VSDDTPGFYVTCILTVMTEVMFYLRVAAQGPCEKWCAYQIKLLWLSRVECARRCRGVVVVVVFIVVVVVVVVVVGGGGGGKKNCAVVINCNKCTKLLVCSRLIVRLLPRHACPSVCE